MEGILYLHYIIMISKHCVCFIILTLVSSITFSQEFPVSAQLEAEIEDSVSAISVVRIKRAKKLLDSIIGQVILDSEQKPLICKYRTAYTTGLHTSSPTTSSCILHAIANIQVKSTGKGEDFRYDGPRRLTNLYDTASVYSALKSCLDRDYMLGLVQKCADETSVFQSFKNLMRLHRIKVYRISDERGRGVYRVDFSPKKNIGHGYHGFKYNGTAYFDRNSLRLNQIKTDKISPSSFDIMGRQAETLIHTICQHYQMDFEEVDGKPVVKQIEGTHSVDNQLDAKFIVKRLPR